VRKEGGKKKIITPARQYLLILNINLWVLVCPQNLDILTNSICRCILLISRNLPRTGSNGDFLNLWAVYMYVFASDSLSDFMQIGWGSDSLSDTKIERLHRHDFASDTVSDYVSDSLLLVQGQWVTFPKM
jgi:hypothetical protein